MKKLRSWVASKLQYDMRILTGEDGGATNGIVVLVERVSYCLSSLRPWPRRPRVGCEPECCVGDAAAHRDSCRRRRRCRRLRLLLHLQARECHTACTLHA
eukprot:scaffold19540_cov55-Phaeocystis_antarctica.AAC.1